MVINSTTKDIELRIDDEAIEIVESVKYLGVVIDEKLSFNEHADKIQAKINKRVALLRRLSDKMTYESKITFVKSLILPLYDYCSSIFMLTDNSVIVKIQRCINKALRIVLKVPRDTSINTMLEKLRILSVEDRVKLNCIKTINKTVHKGVPIILAKKFKMRKNVTKNTRELRNDNQFDIPKWKVKICVKSIFHDGLKMYNDFIKTKFDDKSFLKNCRDFIKMRKD